MCSSQFRSLSLFKVFFISTILSSSAFAADYTIDTDHSTIGFKIRHLGISNVKGQLLKFNGTFSYDPSKVVASSTEAKIEATSIDTDNKKRDDHLRSPEFLDDKKFPLIEFKSKEIQEVTKDGFNVLGDLTIHGITKPVTLAVVNGGVVQDPWGNERAAFTATTKINRKDFGLTWNKVLESGGLVVGEDVQVELEVEGIKKKAV